MLANVLKGATSSAANPNITAFDYITSTSIDRASSSTAFTFSNVSIGSADAKRILVIGVWSFRAAAVVGTTPTMTVGGVSATRVVDRVTVTGYSPSNSLTLFAVAHPTGTSATIVVSHGNATTCGIGVYRMISQSGALTPSTTTTLAYDDNSPPTISTSIQVNTTSSAVVGFSGVSEGLNPTWTGVSKSFGVDIRSNEWFSGARLYPSNTTGSLAVTKTETANRSPAIILASWD